MRRVRLLLFFFIDAITNVLLPFHVVGFLLGFSGPKFPPCKLSFTPCAPRRVFSRLGSRSLV